MSSNTPPKSKKPHQALVKVRPELNLEKWPIWQPANSRTAPRAKVFKREATLSTGDTIVAEVEVGFTQLGMLTTEDQKTYYGLVKYWEDCGRPTTEINFSLRRLAEILGKKWGTGTLKTLTDSLARLYATPFFWRNAYYEAPSGEIRMLKSLEGFRILDYLKIVSREENGHVTKELGVFKFNGHILKNLQSHYTKPVFFNVVLNFKSEIAQLLYTHLDLILSDKLVYERRTKELFSDLNITGSSYDNKRSKRKQVLEPALAELFGVPLSKGGVIQQATIEETKDRADFKVVFVKGASDTAGTAVETPNTPDDIEQEQRQVDELLQYFKTIFQTAQSPNSRHRKLATELISQHGLKLAKSIIDYAHQAAQQTSFRIATFGAISQYIDQAVAELTPSPPQSPADPDSEEINHAFEFAYREYWQDQVKRYIAASYTPEEWQLLLDSKTNRVLAQNPAFRNWQKDALAEFVEAKVLEDHKPLAQVIAFEEFCLLKQKP